MLKRPLVETNLFLRDPEKRREMFRMTVCTSTGIEGVTLTRTDLKEASSSPPRPNAVGGSARSSQSRR
jgi:hypothetical protein